jgi:hypothetical protein
MVSTSLSRCRVHRRSTFSRAEHVCSLADAERSQPIGVLGAELLHVQGAPPVPLAGGRPCDRPRESRLLDQASAGCDRKSARDRGRCELLDLLHQIRRRDRIILHDLATGETVVGQAAD